MSAKRMLIAPWTRHVLQKNVWILVLAQSVEAMPFAR